MSITDSNNQPIKLQNGKWVRLTGVKDFLMRHLVLIIFIALVLTGLGIGMVATADAVANWHYNQFVAPLVDTVDYQKLTK